MAVHVTSVRTVPDLKNNPAGEENVVFTLGVITSGDNKGKIYYWDAQSVEAEDTKYWNIVQVTGVSVGRYKSAFTRVIDLPHGILFMNNGKKEFFTTSAVISGNSDCLVNLTFENTATGTPIFDKILFDDSKAIVDNSNVNEAVSSCRKTLSANNKQLTHLFYRGSSTTLGNSLTALLGLVIPGFRTATAGTPVTFKVEGT